MLNPKERSTAGLKKLKKNMDFLPVRGTIKYLSKEEASRFSSTLLQIKNHNAKKRNNIKAEKKD